MFRKRVLFIVIAVNDINANRFLRQSVKLFDRLRLYLDVVPATVEYVPRYDDKGDAFLYRVID